MLNCMANIFVPIGFIKNILNKSFEREKCTFSSILIELWRLEVLRNVQLFKRLLYKNGK